jgi:RNA polymerase sigma factor (sigma-70 family)
VFLQVVRGLETFTGDERAFRAWVFTIAHRRLVDELRRGGRRPALTNDEEVAERPGGDVRAEAEATLADRAVRDAIATLAPDQRAVILLRIIGDLTIDEIARAVGKRRGAVKALQRRALRNLERAYPFEDLER